MNTDFPTDEYEADFDEVDYTEADAELEALAEYGYEEVELDS